MNIPTIDLAQTGANIVNLRKAAGLTVADIQMVFGFNSPQAIYKWQNGTALPTVDNLIVLAALLNVRIDDILVVNALDADFTIVGDGKHHFIMCDGHRQRIYAYPSMWSEFSDMLPEDAITLSDKMLKYALPMADAKIRSMI